MDTIQIAIQINKAKMGGFLHNDLQKLRRFIGGIQSPYGHFYCECLEVSVSSNLIVKISYPRYYAGINAHQITNAQECMAVQNDFCLKLMNHPILCDAVINLNRVDIPFTFTMHQNYNFYSYRKVYQVFNYIYKRKNPKATPKAFTDIDKFREETLIYANTASVASFNSRIMIYDQFNNIKAKTDDEEKLIEFESKYEDLSKRMRIEVSKRVRRKGFTVLGFNQFNIFGEYMPKYKQYILDNILDLTEVENFYNEKSQELAARLLSYRGTANNFIYETFIYKEIHHIYDYEIIRRALKLCIEKQKTREKAITSVKKILNAYQLNENIIIMEVHSTIQNIRNVIEQYF